MSRIFHRRLFKSRCLYRVVRTCGPLQKKTPLLKNSGRARPLQLRSGSIPDQCSTSFPLQIFHNTDRVRETGEERETERNREGEREREGECGREKLPV